MCTNAKHGAREKSKANASALDRDCVHDIDERSNGGLVDNHYVSEHFNSKLEVYAHLHLIKACTRKWILIRFNKRLYTLL